MYHNHIPLPKWAQKLSLSVTALILFLIGVLRVRHKAEYINNKKMTVKGVSERKIPHQTKSKVRGVVVINTHYTSVYDLIGSVPGCTDDLRLTGYRYRVSPGETLSVWVKNNCSGGYARTSKDNTKTLGIILILLGLLMIPFVIMI
jgi:hypothetical protein